MSTQTISDYITKQIFIEKNIVTYRSLSRQFSLHVNAAKNELATYHHNAPYQSQNSCATFLINGSIKKVDSGWKDSYEDVDMDQTQESGHVEERDRAEEDDSDEVSQTTVLLVNEKDLEDAKAKYDVIDSVYVYSLAPAPLIDSALICNCNESVKSIDKSKGPEWAATVGRVVLSGITTRPSKMAKLPVAPSAPVAGPSKAKPIPAPEPTTTKTETMKTKAEVKPATSVAPSNKTKEKNNASFNFFTKRKDTKDTKPPEAVKKVKKEETLVDLNKKMFFSKPAETTTSGPSIKVEKGIKKEVSSRDDVKTKVKQPEKRVAEPSIPLARRKILISSDEESDEAPAKSTSRRRSRPSFKSESSGAMDSEAEREARALMDLDDDQVERVSHAPSTAVSDLEDQSEPESVPTKVEQDVEDVEMADVSAAPIRPKKRKAKTTIPVGRNGLKKRKIVRTTSRKDDNGYICKEDYTDWESVDEEEPESEKKGNAKTKTKAATIKKEAAKEYETPPATPEEVKRKGNEATRKREPATKAAASRAKTKVKTQQGLKNFFTPGKKT